MQRSELEHLIRASGEVAGDDEIIIIGSQAILGQFPDAPSVDRLSVAPVILSFGCKMSPSAG
jgi:dihydrofolate reductase